MSTTKGYLRGYNAQAVANEDQVIVAASVTDEQNDLAQLHPMIEATESSLYEAGSDDRTDKLHLGLRSAGGTPQHGGLVSLGRRHSAQSSPQVAVHATGSTTPLSPGRPRALQNC